MRTLAPDLLKTLVAFADTGSLTRAAKAVGRTASAVTAHVQRLEADVGAPLLAPAGRGRTLTPAGEVLVQHARRILVAHRDAWLGVASVAGAESGGHVALGLTQDFVDDRLTELLAVFARTRPGVRLEFRVGRSSALAAAITEGALDVAVAMRAYEGGQEVAVFSRPMCWLCVPDASWASFEELPIAALDAPCIYREAACAALDRVRRPYRLAATGASLSGVKAAVRAGIAVTVRTQQWADAEVRPAPMNSGLPKLHRVAETSVRVKLLAAPPALELAMMLAGAWA